MCGRCKGTITHLETRCWWCNALLCLSCYLYEAQCGHDGEDEFDLVFEQACEDLGYKLVRFEGDPKKLS